MAIYRKVHVRMWGDKKFRNLPNDAKLLFSYLFTGPHTTQLPGLSEAGEMRLAEVLGWDIKDFRVIIQLLIDQEMVCFDQEARVLFLPNAIKHNLPANPNIITGWEKLFDLIPESELKNQFINNTKPYMERLGIPFAKRFAERFNPDETVTTTVYQTPPKPVTGAVTGTEAVYKSEQNSKKSKPKKTILDPTKPDQFDLFRKYYPKTHHNEKLNTIQQWNITLKERNATPEQLIEAAKIYSALCHREGRMQKHIKGSQVFLGHRMHWKDILESGIRPDVSEVSESNIDNLSEWAKSKEAEENDDNS